MPFTIWSRLKQVVSTPSGRKHLLRTWRFSLNQAIRAMSGVQVSEVLDELERFSNTLVQTLQSGDRMITAQGFTSLAGRFSAGKLSGHPEVYSLLDLKPDSVKRVLEIGIGTNDETAASSMGKNGVPGASLRMWETLFPNAEIFGADVDPKSHIFTDRIRSVHLDSTDYKSIEKLCQDLSLSHDSKNSQFDLVIDDGLHTPESNLRLLNQLFPLVRTGGFYIVEDIPVAWKGFWSVFSASIPSAHWALVDSSTLGIGSHCFMVIKKM
jgi:hypothetical protein